MVHESKMPEPVAFLTRDDDGEPAMLFFDKQEARGYCEADEEPDSLYTAADLELAKQEATRQAMERCAEACDDQEEPAWYGYENPNTFDDGKRACAKAIRALSNEAEKRHQGDAALPEHQATLRLADRQRH